MQRNVVLPVIKRSMATNPSSSHKIVSREGETAVHRPLAKDEAVKSTRLGNGLLVVSIENNSPLSRVTAIFRAGCRYETVDNMGIVHRIRNSVGFPAGSLTAIALTHEIAKTGGFVESTASRDFLTYELHAARNNLPAAIFASLSQMANPKFPYFDLKESAESLLIDHAALRLNYPAHVMELLHKAAYRTSPLSNSVCCPKRMMGKHDTAMLESYCQKYLVSGNGALIGLGVDHEFLVRVGNEAFPVPEGGAANTVAAKYGGGEVRKARGGHLAAVALAAEGVSLKDANPAAIQSVLGAALGTGPQLKWSEGGSRLGKAVQEATTNPFYVSSLNVSHSDSGLFGIQYFGYWKDSAKIAKAAIGEFRKVASQGITDAELKGARARAKLLVMAQAENGHNVIEDLARQTMVRPGSYVSPSELVEMIDKVSASDVQQAAKKVLGSKLSMATIGHLDNTPYLDELL